MFASRFDGCLFTGWLVSLNGGICLKSLGIIYGVLVLALRMLNEFLLILSTNDKWTDSVTDKNWKIAL